MSWGYFRNVGLLLVCPYRKAPQARKNTIPGYSVGNLPQTNSPDYNVAPLNPGNPVQSDSGITIPYSRLSQPYLAIVGIRLICFDQNPQRKLSISFRMISMDGVIIETCAISGLYPGLRQFWSGDPPLPRRRDQCYKYQCLDLYTSREVGSNHSRAYVKGLCNPQPTAKEILWFA